MKKLLTAVVVLAVLGLIGWRVYQKLTEKQASNQRATVAVAVEVEPVRRETIRNVAEFTGALLPKSQFVVAPKVLGRLEKLLVDIGDSVKQGDLVAVLDSEEYAQQLEQARAELEVSRANLTDVRSALDLANREFQRFKGLREQDVASESQLDEAEARYRAAEAKTRVAEAQIKQKEAAQKGAEVRLSYSQIHAVWEDGDETRKIAERFVDEGALLKANDPIVSVVDISSVIAVINVIERDYPDVRVGQAATVMTDAYEGREFTGRIVRRAPVLQEESGQARVEIEIPNPQGLLAPGMFVRARIQFAERADVTVISTTALVGRNGKRGVFLADTKEMKARFVPVTLGISRGEIAEVLEPDLQGSMVITLGQHLLEDGASILVPGLKPALSAPPTPQTEGGGAR